MMGRGGGQSIRGLINGRPLGLYTPQMFGAKADGATNDSASIQAAYTAIDAAGGGELYFPKGTYVITTGGVYTIPSTIECVFAHGAILSVTAGTTVSFAGGFTATRSQHFTDTSDVRFTGRARRVLTIWWGAAWDGDTNDSVSIQAAISSLLGNVYKSIVECEIGTTRAYNLKLQDNIDFRGFGSSLTIIKAPTDFSPLQPLIGGINETALHPGISVSNLTIDGNRDGVVGGSSGNGNAMGIRVAGWSGARLRNLVIRNCWTDGLYVTGWGVSLDNEATDLTCHNVRIHDCRRNNCSLVCLDGGRFSNCSFILGGSVTGLGQAGTAPKDGLDCEPDAAGLEVKNLRFSNCEFSNNLGCGFRYYLASAAQTTANIQFDSSCSFNNNTEWGAKINHGVNLNQLFTLNGHFIDNTLGGIELQRVARVNIGVFQIRGSGAGFTGIKLTDNVTECCIGTGTIIASSGGAALNIAAASNSDTRVSNGLRIASGTIANSGTRTRWGGKLISTRSIDIGSIAAGATTDFTITVTGTLATDAVSVSRTTALEAGLAVIAVWPSTDTINVRLYNFSGGAVDPATAVWIGSSWPQTVS